MEAIQILLIQIAVILLLSRLLGAAMRLIHQPQVIGEMIAGIMLGPSLLGLVYDGAWMHALFPPSLMGNTALLAPRHPESARTFREKVPPVPPPAVGVLRFRR